MQHHVLLNDLTFKQSGNNAKVRVADEPERGTLRSLLRVGAVKSCRVQAHDTEGVGIVDAQAVEMAAEWHRKSADSKNKAPRTVVRRALETWELRLVLAFGTSSGPLRIAFVVSGHTYSWRRASSASSASWSNTLTSSGLLGGF